MPPVAGAPLPMPPVVGAPLPMVGNQKLSSQNGLLEVLQQQEMLPLPLV